MEKYEIRILKSEYEEDIIEIDEKLEKISINLNAMRFNVEDGFGFWDDYGKRTKKLIKESQELWITKSFIEKKLEDLEQSSLDVYKKPEDQIKDEEPTEEEIGDAIKETDEFEEGDKE